MSDPEQLPPGTVPPLVPPRRMTPMLQQYVDAKAQCPEALLLFRMGDFFEVFFEDAKVAARELDLTLTARDKGDNPVPMAGVPHHAVSGYIAKLLERGYSVALCDQIEDPKQAKGLVKRQITRVITPGTIADLDALDPGVATYLATLLPGTADSLVVGLLDLLAGELLLTQCQPASLGDELRRMNVREVLCVDMEPQWVTGLLGPESKLVVRAHPGARDPQPPATAAHIQRTFLARFGCDYIAGLPKGGTAVQRAAIYWAIHYAEQTQRRRLTHLLPPRAYRAADTLMIDEATRQNLELSMSQRDCTRRGSLLWHLDRCQCAMGSRLLHRWMHAALRDLHAIARRADAVELLCAQRPARQALVKAFAGVRDVERLVGRVAMERATPKDLAALRDSLAALTPIRQVVTELLGQSQPAHGAPAASEAGAPRHTVMQAEQDPVTEGTVAQAAHAETGHTDHSAESIPKVLNGSAVKATQNAVRQPSDGAATPLHAWLQAEPWEALQALWKLLDRALVDNPPVTALEGGVFAAGYCPDLDALLSASQQGHDFLHDLERRERARSGISSLKVRYNRVFGYYLEITRANLGQVPADYIRKQTLVNAERFITEELKAFEEKVLFADERRKTQEAQMFGQLCQSVEQQLMPLRTFARLLAQTDALQSLADAADTCRYVRPALCEGPVLELHEARHPVLERLLPGGERFIPNDLHLGQRGTAAAAPGYFLMITGPNMAGKSTVMRQAALCVLMAQMGGFVPASSARIGLCDRLFTRVGASDNLGRGHSTFMVEMMETATILKHATCQSLVLLDEIGRGTSTFDGLAIAMSVAEYLHDKVRCRTLFATHYHELCKLADKHPQMVNVQMAVGHHGEELIFLRSLVAGAADKSYGVEVARLAGLPPAVLRRAKALLQVMERDERRRQPQLALFPSDAVPTELPPARVPLAAPAQNSLQHKLAMLDPNHLTPLQALTALAELKQVVEERRGD